MAATVVDSVGGRRHAWDDGDDSDGGGDDSDGGGGGGNSGGGGGGDGGGSDGDGPRETLRSRRRRSTARSFAATSRTAWPGPCFGPSRPAVAPSRGRTSLP